jgi:hypothetical protein
VPADGFLYGFAHFTQERDASSKRGYLQVKPGRFATTTRKRLTRSLWQRSLVLLSQHPYPSLFSTLVATLGPLYHAHGPPMLEAACHNVASWYRPLSPL